MIPTDGMAIPRMKEGTLPVIHGIAMPSVGRSGFHDGLLLKCFVFPRSSFVFLTRTRHGAGRRFIDHRPKQPDLRDGHDEIRERNPLDHVRLYSELVALRQ